MSLKKYQKELRPLVSPFSLAIEVGQRDQIAAAFCVEVLVRETSPTNGTALWRKRCHTPD
jgi:hypothetical protein